VTAFFGGLGIWVTGFDWFFAVVYNMMMSYDYKGMQVADQSVFIHGIGYDLHAFKSILEMGILTQREASIRGVAADIKSGKSESEFVHTFDGTADRNGVVYRIWGLDGIVFVVDKQKHGKKLIRTDDPDYLALGREKEISDKDMRLTESIDPGALVGIIIPKKHKDMEISQLPYFSFKDRIAQAYRTKGEPFDENDPELSRIDMGEIIAKADVSEDATLTLEQFVKKHAPHLEISYTPEPTMSWKERKVIRNEERKQEEEDQELFKGMNISSYEGYSRTQGEAEKS